MREAIHVIQVQDVHKRFGIVAAVRGMSFAAPDGHITGMLGENGAGKTTTLALICGLIRPDGGSIQVGPRETTPLERRRQVGALLDHKGLYGRLTARENIAYFGELHGVPAATLGRRVQEILVLLGLERLAERPAAGFSQGERMKVALGRAIVHSPPHLLLDEPTNGLDIPSVHALREVLRRMRDRGTCVVFSSHVFDDVRALCDTVVIVSRGRVVANGEPAEICRRTGCAALEDAVLQFTSREETVS